MITKPGVHANFSKRCRIGGGRVLSALGALGFSLPLAHEGRGGEPGLPTWTRCDWSADAPHDHAGVMPPLLALNETTGSKPDIESTLDRHVIRAKAPEGEAAEATPPRPATDAKEEIPRVASTVSRTPPLDVAREPAARTSTTLPPASSAAQPDSIAQAKRAIAECKARYAHVRDYTCVFHKRELIGGRLTAPHIMVMKVRTQPMSIYFKFQKPNRGREAIYVAGRHNGRVVAHDVGLGKLFAGTMHLDPKGSMAMEENRHPITEAGIAALIDTIAKHWSIELTPEESRVTFHPNVAVSSHPCTMIESVHPQKHPHFLYHIVKLYIDHEHGLPIRFEAYDWPKHSGAGPELVEEYTYLNLRTNVGLRDEDFDPANSQYSFGRF